MINILINYTLIHYLMNDYIIIQYIINYQLIHLYNNLLYINYGDPNLFAARRQESGMFCDQNSPIYR